MCAPLCLLLGCREETHAALASDGYKAPPAKTSSSDEFVDDEESAVQYCGETSVLLPIKRPTFYFIVDSSESMANLMPNSGGRDRSWAARTAISQMLRVLGDRVDFGAAAFPGHAEETCAAGEQVFAPHRGDRTTLSDGGVGSTGPVLDALLFNLGRLGTWGSTPTSATLAALRPALEGFGPKTTAFLLTDGVPNCSDVSSCPSEQCVGDLDHLRLTNGMICGNDVACCDETQFPWLCLDTDATNENLAALAKAGVSTYVIGFPGSEAYADVLDSMARAAGTARLDMETEYYRVADVSELAETLTQLGQDLTLDCSIVLDEEPDDRKRVSVLADGKLIEKDDADGWHWQGRDAVTLAGKACERWREGRWDQLSIVEDCDFRVR